MLASPAGGIRLSGPRFPAGPRSGPPPDGRCGAAPVHRARPERHRNGPHPAVGRHGAPHRPPLVLRTRGVAAVPGSELEGLVDVVDREGHAVHTDLVGPGGLRPDRVGVGVLGEVESNVAVRRPSHRDVGVVAVQADGSVSSLPTDRRPADDGQPEVRGEADRRFGVPHDDADVTDLDGYAPHADWMTDSKGEWSWAISDRGVGAPMSSSCRMGAVRAGTRCRARTQTPVGVRAP